MEIIRGQLHLTRSLSQCVLTIGNFDGFHQGHQQLIEKLQAEGRRLNCPTAVVTFEPQPKEFFNREAQVPRLMRFQEKWNIFEEKKIDYLICLQFKTKLAEFPAEEFVKKILLSQLGMKSIVIGDDFAFGSKRKGNIELLQEMGKINQFAVTGMPSLLFAGKRISSTWVRQALIENNLQLAAELLGRPYFLCGRIVHGDKRGREWGIPTANITLKNKRVCVDGIYAVHVQGLRASPVPGVASVGIRPMFPQQGMLLEVHLLDFEQDIYGKRIKVEFLEKIRDEKKFASTAELIAQIEQDIQVTRRRFNVN